MSCWFISDAHFGHENIANFADRPIVSEADNVRWITECWTSVVSKKTAGDRSDIVFCLGDMAFNERSLGIVHAMPGRKVLIKGNHDVHSPQELEVYKQIHGLLKYKGMWLSHPPIHDQELRGKPNIHGHVHSATLGDPRYFNICPENIYPKFGRPMINLDELRAWVSEYHSPLHA